MKKFFVIGALALVSSSALAMDHRSQFGVGGSLGATFAAPWASEAFRRSVSAKVPALSVWGRYIPGTPEVGTELSYNYFSLGKQNVQTHALVFSFISRQNPWGGFHPFYAFGIGYSASSNYFATGNWTAPVFKLTAGIEFEMNERVDVGFYLNHFSLFKNQPSEPNLHVLSPQVTVSYYFGKPAPLPSAPVAAPIPDPTPPALTAPPPASKQPVQKKARPKKRSRRR